MWWEIGRVQGEYGGKLGKFRVNVVGDWAHLDCCFQL